jgi:hypothetical protein
MDTTYDVNVWSIRENVGTTAKTYSVRWKVGSRRWKTTFKTAALADSFRSDLLSAARKGEASLEHADTDRNVDTRWTQIPAHSRTRPDPIGHTTRPLTLISPGQKPCCAGGGW